MGTLAQFKVDRKLKEANSESGSTDRQPLLPSSITSARRDPPDWALEGSRKFTTWLGDPTEKEMAKLMTPAEGTKMKGTGGKKSVPALSKDMAGQVGRVKAVLDVPGIKYIQNKGKIGWNEKDWLIWILLTFEGKIKSYRPY
jgi:hypothetical protein